MFERLRHLLGASERKVSRAARLIALQGGAQARWTPRDYAALAREGYFSSDEWRLRVARRIFFTSRSDGDSGCTDFRLISTP